jgi:hypothetical protein
MKKWIFSLSLLFTLSLSSAQNQEMTLHSHEHAPQIFTENDPEYLHPDSVKTHYLRVKAEEIEGFSGKKQDKLQEAFVALERVVNSQEFKNRVINFKNSQGERAFASNKGLSNEEIYELLMEGREDLQPHTPGEMNFYLKLYHRPFSRVIGYTSPDTNRIHVNWKFFKRYEASEVAANLMHEWLHKMGYRHRSANEHDSVPYAIGYIVGEMIREMPRP